MYERDPNIIIPTTATKTPGEERCFKEQKTAQQTVLTFSRELEQRAGKSRRGHRVFSNLGYNG